MCAKVERKQKSKEQALSSLMALCAKAERSSGDALRLMRGWGVAESEQQEVLKRLIEERFIDDERYATLFVREKTKLNGWGVYRLRTALYNKGIAREVVDEKIAELDREGLKERLTTLISKRAATTKYTTKYQLRDKLIRYGASLGYDFEMVSDVVRERVEGIDFDF